MTLRPRAVVIHRRTEFEELVARHGTSAHAAFFLEARGRDLSELEQRRVRQQRAMAITIAAIPDDWRRAEIERGNLPRFLFEPEDIVIVIGQDGLVANTAKYLDGQPVIGINPDPSVNPGVLVAHPPEDAAALMSAAVMTEPPIQRRTMVEATTDDGRSLRALNELYVGQRSHQSSRYRLDLADGRSEHQSSSGVLVGTGTGATGWLRSAAEERRSPIALPSPTAVELCWFVREAWPSPATGTLLTEGLVAPSTVLTLGAESDELVCFGDGIEGDGLTLSWGQQLTIGAAARHLRLIEAEE